jgi:acyl dehydratase
MVKIQCNSEYKYDFTFTQKEVIAFAEITGDKNPIHLDEDFAAKSIFKKRILHGFLGGSVFSKILATFFPGEGTIYLEQSMKFLRPMQVEKKYTAICKVEEILPRNRAKISTLILDTEELIYIQGQAIVLNTERIPSM